MAGDDHDHGHDHGHDDARGHGHDDAQGHADDHDHGHDHAPVAAGRGHDHGHGHAHLHALSEANERRLLLMLALVVVYIGVEVVGGLLSGSLALLADAGHMVSDGAALAITLVALRLARRPATARRTYGFHRAEILAATLNGAALAMIAVGILWEAIERWSSPPDIDGPVVMAVATGGLLVNLAGLAVLHGGRDTNLNLRSAWLHVLSDALGSVGALAAGAAVWLWGARWADPLASVIIAALVLRGAWSLLDDALHVLMEGAPPHIDVDAVRAALIGTPGVLDVHDLHVWTITSNMVAMSGHVVVAEGEPHADMLRRLAALLHGRFGIAHTTIQVEPPGFEEAEIFHP